MGCAVETEGMRMRKRTKEWEGHAGHGEMCCHSDDTISELSSFNSNDFSGSYVSNIH